MRFNEFKAIDQIDALSPGEELVAPFDYTVKKGDSLWKIANRIKKLGITYDELVASNPQIKNPDIIFPGDKITIPVKKSTTPKAPEIERGHPTMKDDPRLKPNTEKPTVPTDDGSFDKAEKARLSNHPAAKVEPKVEPKVDKPNTDSKAGAGRGLINPGPVGKGAYKIPNGDTARHVFEFFKSNGFNDVQAAALVGNAYHESGGLDPKALGDYDDLTKTIPTSGGIFQWHNTRWIKLEIFAKRNKKSWKDLDLQLNFAMHELNGSHANVVTALNQEENKNNIKNATKVVMDLYENPKKSKAKYEDRLGWATTALEAFGTAPPKKPAQ